MHPGMKLNNGKIYAKGIDGEVSELGVIKNITSVELDAESECTYGGNIEDLGINKEYSIALNLANTHKVWKKKRKGKRWVLYPANEEWAYKHLFKPIYSDKVLKKVKRYSEKLYGPKKPRGKRIKHVRNYIRFCNEWTKNNYIDYTSYTKDCEEVEMKYPGDDEIYKYKVLEHKDNAKLEAIVTKRIDELKERKEK